MLAHDKAQRGRFAERVRKLVEDSSLTQAAIAERLGYANHNIITMFKNGTTRMPLEKVTPFARAVGADPSLLLREWFRAYAPGAWSDLARHFGPDLTRSETTWISGLRDTFGRVPPFDPNFGQALRRIKPRASPRARP